MPAQDHSFTRSHRLITPADFQAVFKDPIRARSPYFTVLARENEEAKARLGVIVAKRMVKRAVRRNAIRRIIRESFRSNQEVLAGLDIVVLIRCPLAKQPNKFYFESLKQQWLELNTQRKK